MPRPAPLGPPCDPFFGLSLWLQAPCRNETLWAYNLEHLAHLTAIVSSSLRERPRGERHCNGRKILSTLPRWLTAAHARVAVLRALEQLRRRAIE